jgi:hypothetical protein
MRRELRVVQPTVTKADRAVTLTALLDELLDVPLPPYERNLLRRAYELATTLSEVD